MILEVVKAPDKSLHRKTEVIEVVDEKLEKLLDDMYETMVENDGIGIAAPQVSSRKRVALVQLTPEDELFTLINPVITKKSGSDIFVEGCLSIPHVFGTVERAEEIVVEFHERSGNFVEMEASGFLARAIQHEVDHLDGILFTEKMIERIPEEELEDYYQKYEEEHND
ncbi:peptide deformylase [Pilibacter termitis]|uniref:Peptide deformylase n=1 Tax=Pilibacter termitis TaxID=263852 RepID=A0A1T4PYT4_9ENTE|nr:peptide deformylase [Pilibacter termitis]SJZ96128.1 peptide deformylase [Pilibacter termitis]